jgi:hypothetical protein
MLIKCALFSLPLPFPPPFTDNADSRHRVRTLTGKEIELDIEPDYRVWLRFLSPPTSREWGRERKGADDGIYRYRKSRRKSRRKRAFRLCSKD